MLERKELVKQLVEEIKIRVRNCLDIQNRLNPDISDKNTLQLHNTIPVYMLTLGGNVEAHFISRMEFTGDSITLEGTKRDEVSSRSYWPGLKRSVLGIESISIDNMYLILEHLDEFVEKEKKNIIAKIADKLKPLITKPVTSVVKFLTLPVLVSMGEVESVRFDGEKITLEGKTYGLDKLVITDPTILSISQLLGLDFSLDTAEVKELNVKFDKEAFYQWVTTKSLDLPKF